MTCPTAHDQLPVQPLEENRRGAGRSLPLSNHALADRLEEVAVLLEAQQANAFRVKAYRDAAETVRNLDQRVHTLLSGQGMAGLQSLPGIGESLARTIEQLVFTDRCALLDRLRGGSGSVDLFAMMPGIGPTLARRIHEDLGIESLQELEVAAYDDRLSQVHGMGRGRIRALQESLAGSFRRRAGMPESSRSREEESVPVSELLDIDREYREKAQANSLPTIAPRRFNPTGEAWLPVMHAHRGDRHYTALHSNTGRAHDLGMTRDWVVIYRDDHRGRGQWTVVTARLGALSGKRIVSGRDAECRRYYAEG
jgi:DNA polymerase (family 10)